MTSRSIDAPLIPLPGLSYVIIRYLLTLVYDVALGGMYLSRCLHAFPDAEVDDGEHSHEAEDQLPARCPDMFQPFTEV